MKNSLIRMKYFNMHQFTYYKSEETPKSSSDDKKLKKTFIVAFFATLTPKLAD